MQLQNSVFLPSNQGPQTKGDVAGYLTKGINRVPHEEKQQTFSGERNCWRSVLREDGGVVQSLDGAPFTHPVSCLF